MIRINLLQQPQRKRPRRFQFSRRYIVILCCVSTVVIAVVAGWYGKKKFLTKSGREQEVTRDVAVVKPDISHTLAVEDIVRDLDEKTDKLKRSGYLNLPYEQLSFIEKINYEIHFAKNIIEVLAQTVKPGVDFRTIEAKEFKTLWGQGLSNSRDDITYLLTSLRDKNITLRPKPHTHIVRKRDYYQFTLSSVCAFGLDLGAPFLVARSDIIEDEDISFVIKNIVAIANETSVNFTSGPKQYDKHAAGNYKRYRYTFTAVSSYNNFVLFVGTLYNRHIQCAFERFRLTAKTDTTLKIDADIIFTTLSD